MDTNAESKMMLRLCLMLAMIAALIFAATGALGHRATERYIPLGQSPGVSGYVSYIGEIVSIDPGARSITVLGPNGERSTKVTDQTNIWLDRTGLLQSNLVGSFEDLQPGQRVEIKFVDDDRANPAAWIKIEVLQ